MNVFKILLVCCVMLMSLVIRGQNINFEITLNYEKIAALVDQRIMINLETYLNNFINKKKWVSNSFNTKSNIKGHLLLTLEAVQNTVFSGFLIVQSERLTFNTSYYSPLFSFKDNEIKFEFKLDQIDDFNENNFIASNNPLQMNLPAILTFYINIILGFDADSFGIYEGSRYFNKAFQIATNAATNPTISNGWTPFINNNNRFVVAQEMNSEKYKYLHTSIYKYFRQCLDQLYDSKEKAIQGLEETLNDLSQLKTEVGYSLNFYLFMNIHKEEMLKIATYIKDDKHKKEIIKFINKLH